MSKSRETSHFLCEDKPEPTRLMKILAKKKARYPPMFILAFVVAWLLTPRLVKPYEDYLLQRYISSDGGVGLVVFCSCLVLFLLFFLHIINAYRSSLEDALNRKIGKWERVIIEEHRDEQGRLHYDSGPAVVRRNGNREYWIHGVMFWNHEGWLKYVHGDISIDDLLKEENSERRRILGEKLSAKRLAEGYNSINLVDRSSRGNSLYKYYHPNLRKEIRIVKYKDPSSSQWYFSFVPPDIKEADEAMAWKFQLLRTEYDSLREET